MKPGDLTRQIRKFFPWLGTDRVIEGSRGENGMEYGKLPSLSGICTWQETP